MSTEPIFKNLTKCRACQGINLKVILSLGDLPLADRLVETIPTEKPEPRIPTTLLFCSDCTLVQLKETVLPEILFCDSYPYFSSISPQLVDHFRRSAENLINERKLDRRSLVVEAASNDGCMLKNFVKNGIKAIGVDPSDAPVKAALQRGITTINDFFCSSQAIKLRNTYPAGCDLFLANNVLAHVSSLRDFIDGISIILSSKGLAVIEVPYLVSLIDKCEFDTIYHQHLCYFTLTSLMPLFSHRGLYINRVEQIAIHGGSLRLFIEKEDHRTASIETMLLREQKLGTGEMNYYNNFNQQVETLKSNLLSLLTEITNEHCTIAGYGAAAKACTLLNYCNIGTDILPYIVDKNQFKHNKFMGGSHTPIKPVTELYKNTPDYLLILAWNFAEEIMTELSAYKQQGGKFILPIPEISIK